MMTNEELELRFARLVKTERKITLEVLRLIGEAERRRHYLERGFGSLLDWLTRGHGYSQPAAYRRIQAARLLPISGDIGKSISSGSLNLTVLSQVQGTLKREESRTGAKIPNATKIGLVEAVKEKSVHETERILREHYPLAQKKEVLRYVSGEESRLSLNLSRKGLADLTRAREILSHVFPNGSWSQIIAYLAQDFVQRKDRPKSVTVNRCVKPRKSTACEFRDEKTGRVCGSRYQLQRDHILPRALGGTDAPENLRMLCRKHNIHEAERLLGKELMDQFRN